MGAGGRRFKSCRPDDRPPEHHDTQNHGRAPARPDTRRTNRHGHQHRRDAEPHPGEAAHLGHPRRASSPPSRTPTSTSRRTSRSRFRKGKVPAPIIDQRACRGAVIEYAVSEGLDGFYRESLQANEVRTAGRPSGRGGRRRPSDKDFLRRPHVEVEVDALRVRAFPALDTVTVEIDETDEDGGCRLDRSAAVSARS
ncbi:MAG: trigger factor [Microbacterium sp.]